MDDDECGAVGGMMGRGYQSTGRKPAPDTVSNPGSRHGMPATNRLCYGTSLSDAVMSITTTEPNILAWV
jgi:hypothetical protein